MLAFSRRPTLYVPPIKFGQEGCHEVQANLSPPRQTGEGSLLHGFVVSSKRNYFDFRRRCVIKTLPGRGEPKRKITQISQIIIEPMLVNVTGLSTTWIGGQPFLVVTMVATNNIGLVPTWRSEKVKLISVNFTMNYNSTSVAESVNGGLVQPAIPTPMTFSANESKTFSVTVGPLPSGIGGTLVVQVNGWYSWFFAARGADENPPIGITNGGGRFVPFSGTVTI